MLFSTDDKYCVFVISNILVPTDFSPASWKATQVGIELTRLNTDAELSILHIYPDELKSPSNKNSGFFPSMDQVRLRMNNLLQNLLDVPNEKIRSLVLSVNIKKIIMNLIEEQDFDLIIIGINSNGFDNQIGSHTLLMLETSSIPVMVVPNSSIPHETS